MLPAPVTFRRCVALVPASASVVTVCAASTTSVPPALFTESVSMVLAVEQVKFVKVFEPTTARPVPVVSVGAYTKSFMFVFAAVVLPVRVTDAPVIVILAALASRVPAFVMPPLVSMSPKIVVSALASTVRAAIVPAPNEDVPAATSIVGEAS